jgi:hypothetical protein
LGLCCSVVHTGGFVVLRVLVVLMVLKLCYNDVHTVGFMVLKVLMMLVIRQYHDYPS